MIEFKPYTYTELENCTNRLLIEFNELEVSKLVTDYINGKPVNEIDVASTLRQQANDKASKLSNYKEMLSVGVDISVTIPDCQVSNASLAAIVSLVETYQNNTQYKYSLAYIAFDKKANKFVMTEKGKAELENRIIKLTGNEEKAYLKVYELKELLDKLGLYTARKVLSDKILHEWNNVLFEQTFVKILISKG